MDILGLTTINKFDNEADYLVSLELSEEEKERIADENSRWKSIIDSTIAHVWVNNDEITYVDLSVFDNSGDWEDCIPADIALTNEAVENIRKFVRDLLEKEKSSSQSTQTDDTLLRLDYDEASIAGGYEELSVFTIDSAGEEVLIESDFEMLNSMEKGSPLYIYGLHNELLQFMKTEAPLPFTKDELAFLYQAVLSSAISEKEDAKRQDELIFKLEFLMEHLGYDFDTQESTDTGHNMER